MIENESTQPVDTEIQNVITVGDEDFEARVVGSDIPVLVDFWAEWCTPCHIISPAVEAIAREQAGRLVTAKLNVDESPQTPLKFGVMSIPTLLLFKGGEVKARLNGARGKDAIWREIEPHVVA
jgi:thioredoxin 1